jgi:hypothetical protein
MQPTLTCKNCGNHFQGKYCNQCGEKVYSPKDKSMVHVIEEVFHFITHFDGSFFTTLKTFLSKPGKMSAEFTCGLRKKYFKPVSFFLLIVITYLLFPRFPGLNMRFQTYVSEEYNFRWFSVPVAREKMRTAHLTETELNERYDHTSPAISKVSLFLLIPLCAWVLAVIYFSSRKYFFDHFILAAEIMSFYIFFQFLLIPLLALIVEKTIPAYRYLFNENIRVILPVAAIMLVYTTIAFRNFYRQKLWLSALKAALFLTIFVLCIRYVYNTVLYLLVMAFA